MTNQSLISVRSDWTFDDWSKKDPDGLANILNSHPNEFNQLFRNQYGVDYETPKNRTQNRPSSEAGTTVLNMTGERQNWTFDDWSKKDPDGLANIMNNHPDEFKILYKDQYGEDYVKPKNQWRGGSIPKPIVLNSETRSWSWQDWESNDPIGLLKLQRTNPDHFNALVENYPHNSKSSKKTLELRQSSSMPINAKSVIDEDVMKIYYDVSELLKKTVDIMNQRLEKTIKDNKLKVNMDEFLEDEEENRMLGETVIYQGCTEYIKAIDHLRIDMGETYDLIGKQKEA